MSPYASTRCSLVIITDSACTVRLQSWLLSSSAADITANPRPSEAASSTGGVTPSVCMPAQPPPCVTMTLWFHADGPVQRSNGWLPSYRTAMEYALRSMSPLSMRTTYGTVLPWSVVVVSTSGGGLLGSYAENLPVTEDMYW